MYDSLANLQTKLTQQFPLIDVFCLEQVDSTNRYLKSAACNTDRPLFCFASYQTSGYGQQSRKWQSDQTSLTFSLLLDFNVPVTGLDGLSQLIVLNLIECLSDFSSAHFKVKWPNDLYVDDLKAGGILIECVSYTDHSCRLVIGIGLNNGIDLSIEDVLTMSSRTTGSVKVDRQHSADLISCIIQRLITLSECYHPLMFSEYLVNYALVDYFDKDQSVNVYDNGFKKTGVYQGLSQHGELLVEINGQPNSFRSGNVSIRPTNKVT